MAKSKRTSRSKSPGNKPVKKKSKPGAKVKKAAIKKAIKKKVRKSVKKKLVAAKVKKVLKKKTAKAKLKKVLKKKILTKPKSEIKKVVRKSGKISAGGKSTTVRHEETGISAAGELTVVTAIMNIQVFEGPTPLTIVKSYIINMNNNLILRFVIQPPYKTLGVTNVYEGNVLKKSNLTGDFDYEVINKSEQLHVETVFQNPGNYPDLPEANYKFFNGGVMKQPEIIGRINQVSSDRNYRIDAYFTFF